jgi:hypothetical protein
MAQGPGRSLVVQSKLLLAPVSVARTRFLAPASRELYRCYRLAVFTVITLEFGLVPLPL